MSAGSGSLDLVARRGPTRTILERVRYDGISRCSRAFARADAALVVLSQLGPGVVRGDCVTLTGHLRANSDLIVTSQTATRLLGGLVASTARAHWTLDADATLELIGEPLIAAPDAVYTAVTTIELGPRARVLTSELIAVPAAAAVTLRTSIRSGGREIVYDALDAAATAPAVVGTFTVAGLDEENAASVLRTIDTISDEPGADCSIGVGEITGGVFARVIARDVWHVRTALRGMHQATRQMLHASTGVGRNDRPRDVLVVAG